MSRRGSEDEGSGSFGLVTSGGFEGMKWGGLRGAEPPPPGPPARGLPLYHIHPHARPRTRARPPAVAPPDPLSLSVEDERYLAINHRLRIKSFLPAPSK